MKENNGLEMNIDILGIIALVFTIVSILVSFKLSVYDVILSVSIFLIILATSAYLSFRNVINKHAKEIKNIKEKLNIYKELAELRAKMDLLYNQKMNKKAQVNFVEILIRIIQIGAIIFAIYIVLKAFGQI